MIDALMTRALAEELNETLSHGRVQATLALDELTVGLEVYGQQRRHYLIASADGNSARAHLVSDKLRSSGLAPTPFVLLLRKYSVGAFVNQVSAVPRERLLHIEFDHHEFGVSTLIAEMMGHRSNLALVNAEGIVLESIKRVSSKASRVRPIQPNQKYLPPPPQVKADPLALSASELSRNLEEAEGEPAWQVLVRTVAGTSPMLAREVVFRATGSADIRATPDIASVLHSHIREIWEAPSDPTIALEDGEPVAVAAYALTHLGPVEHMDSASVALERYYGAIESYEAVKEPLRVELAEARERLRRKRESLARQLVPEEEIARLRVSGEMILAYASGIGQGQKTLIAERGEGEPFSISLDPKLGAVENAQEYFAKYRHAKEAAASVPARLADAESDMMFADEVINDLEMAETRAEIDSVVSEARAAGLLAGAEKGPKERAVSSGPREFTSPDGLTVLVGRNARQNEQVTFELSSPQDLWLHARGFSGAHVVIRMNGSEVPDTTVEFAAGLAAYYSGGRREQWVDVIVAPRKNVSRVRQGRAARPGLVNVRGERTLRVRPLEP